MEPKTKPVVIRNRTTVSDLWKKEDWLAVWIGAVLIVIAAIAVISKAFDFTALNFSK